ncbi:MAG TPA: RHS repeat-associated core domain-containing protein [Thermoanaerobaculia bacterium]|jgi:RHS repeat-associated protein|nr:RHS repeat-associated core domain-containing protein [Thermoanaerobaculia bacterium]
MKTIAHVLLAAIVTSGLLAIPLHAEEQVQRYIVVLKQRSGAVPDVASLGGKIELRQDDQLVVTIPLGALATLKADPKIRYVERVGGTPSDDESPLIGAPSDPRPGPSSQTARFTPHALGSLAWDSGAYAYDGAGNIVSIGTDNYLYDGVQRLHQSSTQGTPETYTYDGFGNMKTRTNTIIPTVQPSTNRYDGYGYNEVGAVTSDGSYVFTYDALGQPLSKIYNGTSSTLEYYIYTPGDERIGVQRGGWWTWSVRDEAGKVLRQYKSSSTNPSAPALWLEDFVWRDSLLLGSQRPVEMGGRRHFHLDHLGSPRLITADNGQMVSYHDYYPFGDEHSPVSQEVAGGFDREDPMKFTGHERDYAGGMGGEDGHAIDDMHARYYNPTAGRFLMMDPILPKNAMQSPQMWDRYAYAANNPVNRNDPDGRLVRLLGTSDERQQELALIKSNLREEDRKYVTMDKNGVLSVDAKAKGGVGLSMLRDLARKDAQTVDVRFSSTFQAKTIAGPGRPRTFDIQAAAGGGATVPARFSMSGNIEVTVDPRGSIGTGASADLVMGHELIGHAWDYAIKGTTSERSAVTTETNLLLQRGLPPVRPVPSDQEHP